MKSEGQPHPHSAILCYLNTANFPFMFCELGLAVGYGREMVKVFKCDIGYRKYKNVSVMKIPNAMKNSQGQLSWCSNYCTGSLVNKTNRHTEFQFYWYYYSTCFGLPFLPSSGVFSSTPALVHFMQL